MDSLLHHAASGVHTIFLPVRCGPVIVRRIGAAFAWLFMWRPHNGSLRACQHVAAQGSQMSGTKLRIRNGEMTMPRMSAILRALGAALLMAGPGAQAFAADATVPAPAAAQTAALEEVVVTGSRIPVPANISATSPTTVVTSQEIQLQGHTDITDV